MSTTHPKLYKAEYECLNCGWRFELSGLDYPEGDVDCPECNASVWPIASTIRVDSVQVDDPDLQRGLDDFALQLETHGWVHRNHSWLQSLWRDFGRGTVELAMKDHPRFQ